MIEVEEARRRILSLADPLEGVEVEFEKSHGRVLDEDVHADRDFPPSDRSAMDGFAVRWDDVREPGRTLAVTAEIRAGEPVGRTRVDPGSCVRIMTGAIVPPGADTVVMVELTREHPDDGTVTIRGEVLRGQHVRRRGEELRRGEVVLARGQVVHAAEIAALASVGRVRVRIVRPPVVHVLSTGDEVVEPDRLPADHQVRNSNARALLAQLAELGIRGRYLGIAPDSRGALRDAVQRGLAGDVLLITGGVSMGRYDLVGEILAETGMHTVFHGVAIRPGKPLLVGRRGGCLVAGLPGNPVSTFTDFAVFVAPVLRKMAGHARWDNLEVTAVLSERLKRKPGRTTYHLARVTAAGGGFRASPVRNTGSGDVVSMSRANAFVITAAGGHALEAGESVPAVLWKDFHLRAADDTT